MNSERYSEFIREAISYTRAKMTDSKSKWEVSKYHRFDWDQDTGTIVFSGAGASLVADIQFIGSWSERAGTWMWAWANESVDEKMKAEISEVKRFGKAEGLDDLTSSLISNPIEFAWEMSAIACYILQSEMVYRAPDSDKPGFTFLSLKNFRKEK